jgi:hypothetical protein
LKTKAGRIIVSVIVGVVFTVVGFRFGAHVFHAPAWLMSFVFAKAHVTPSNAVMNLALLATNTAVWTVVAYVTMKLSTRKNRART